MKRLTLIAMTVIFAAFLAACGSPAANSPANTTASNTNANTAKPTAAAPTKEAVVALEKAAWEAWKNNDSKYFESNMSDKYVGFGSSGRLDKAGSIRSMSDAKCDVKSYSFSDEKIQMAGPDTVLLTFKGAQDATCSGRKSPAAVWSASIYVRDGDKWKSAFYAEAPVVDPKAPPAKPAAPAAKKEETKPAEAAPDAATTALMAVEKKAWEDWKDKNAKGLDEFAAKDMISLSATEGWTDRESSLKRWADPTCEVKSVSITDPGSVAYGSDYALFTFRSAVDGKCGGQSISPENGATLYVKEGGTWRALMTMGTPIS